jgi:curved DNA-binding protein
MTYYETLGVGDKATTDEIKRAYRKLASQHHPDKGGDKNKFQEIQAAYDTLSDDNKRQQYDMQQSGRGNFRFTVNGQDMSNMQNHPDIEEMFRNFGFNFGGGDPFGNFRQPRRNKDLRIEIPVSLASTLEDQIKIVSIQTSNGHREPVEVKIPRGVNNGSTIKYSGLGDNFFNTLERGDLYVHITVLGHPGYYIDGLDLIVNTDVDCLTAMTGGTVNVNTLDDKTFQLTIPPGSQQGNGFRIKDQGLWQLNSSTKGSLIVKINITIPTNLTTAQLDLIQQIKEDL